MGSFETRKYQLRHHISQQYDALEQLFTEEYTKQISDKENSFASEKQRYLQDIEDLRKRVLKVELLEADNRRLIAEIESTKNESLEKSGGGNTARIGTSHDEEERREPGYEDGAVDIKEYIQVKDSLNRQRNDYEVLLHSNRYLESRVRYYKDMVREWKAFKDDWILRHPSEKSRFLKFQHAKTSPASITRDRRSCSTNAPPSLPDVFAPSVGEFSRPTSPWVGSVRDQSRSKSPETKKRRLSHSKVGEVAAPQPPSIGDHGPSSDDITEASEESNLPINPFPNNPDHDLPNGDHTNEAHQVDEDSDQPVVVSERSLKRKRPDQSREGDPGKQHAIKPEPITSSSIPVQSSLRFELPSDSLDLDDVSGHVDTPKKRRQFELDQSKPADLSPTEVQEQAFSRIDLDKDRPSKAADRKVGLPNDGAHQADGHNDQENEQQKRRLRRALQRQPQQAHNDRVHERLNTPSKNTDFGKAIYLEPLLGRQALEDEDTGGNNPPRPSSEDNFKLQKPHDPTAAERQSNNLASHSVLQPLDANAQLLPRTHESPDKPKKSRPPHLRDRGAAAVPDVAEDGETYGAANEKPRVKPADVTILPDPAVKAPDAHHRLQDLLTKPSPEKTSLDPAELPDKTAKESTSNRTPLTRQTKLQPATPLAVSAEEAMLRKNRPARNQRPGITTGNEIRMVQSTNNKAKQMPPPSGLISVNQLPDTGPEDEPLRSRPIHRLNLSDFKPNPKHSEYAYHESIRKHDEKKDVSGCTDKNCRRCKDMRKFVENSNYATTLPGENTEESNRRLIENYFGGKDGKARYKKMSKEEKEEVLKQARTQQFADKFGKHRQRFGREPSPVDFWNTGFPSTQEEIRNRELVAVRERERVEERYWEALRQGGRFVFADE